MGQARLCIGGYTMARAIATANGTDIDITTPFGKWVSACRGEAELTAKEVSGDEVMATVMDAMLNAESLDAAIAVQDAGLPSAKDFMVGREHSVQRFDMLPSKKQFKKENEGIDLGFWFRVEAVLLENGEPITYSVGASNVMMVIYTARRLGQLPVELIITSKPTENGDLLIAKRVPKRGAVQASAE
jgi:hypothetical protein